MTFFGGVVIYFAKDILDMILLIDRRADRFSSGSLYFSGGGS